MKVYRDSLPAAPRRPGPTGPDGFGRLGVVLAVLVCAVLLAAPARAQAPAGAGYRIGPKDLIEIRVFEVPELNIERRVSEEGTINLPLIGDVPVQGLTDVELSDRLKALLESKYVQRASVAVQIREFRSKPISVLGAVKQPGNLALSGRWTLLEAISAAGGLTDDHGDKIYVLRRADNGLSDQISITVDDLMVRADPNANVPIFANDIINVPAKVEVTVFCLGQVAHPGAVAFQSTERITLLTAVARAGGLTDRASNSIQIKRRDHNGRDLELEANYRRIVSGKDPDVPLQSGDVVIVKESFF
jgi:polysaccharide export outer membrane protein